MTEKINKFIVVTMVGLIRLYRFTLSPFIGGQCRFYPTCSHYAEESIKRHGSFNGVLMAAKRLSKCHPFNPGGIDTVPESKEL
tara:strand:+ start:154 stop:402 length:249 start_codon:yes stop_codon:yes gene_type:complete